MYESGQEVSDQITNPLGLFNDLTSNAAIVNFDQRIQDEQLALNQDNHVAEEREEYLIQQIQGIHSDTSLNDEARENKFEVLKHELGEAIKATDQVKKDKYFMASREDVFRTRGWLMFRSTDEQVTPLIDAIVEGSIRGGAQFMEDRDFMQLADQDRPAIVIDSKDKPVEIPVTAIVSAAGFRSWQDGRGRNSEGRLILKDDKPSHEVIKDYASRETEIPNIDVTAVILPDGKVIYLSENAHRAAAAKMKGQDTIKVNRMLVWAAKER